MLRNKTCGHLLNGVKCNGILQLAETNEPYNGEYYICEKCDSTYNIDEINNRSVLVYALSYNEFIDTMHNNKVTEENIEERPGAIIEIMGEQDLLIFPFYFKHEHNNVLRLMFDDVDMEIPIHILGSSKTISVLPMSEEQGKLIVDFVEANENAKVFFVHCAAGISRSGAVAKWIDQKFNTDDTVFNVNNPIIQPNQRILSILRKLPNYE